MTRKDIIDSAYARVNEISTDSNIIDATRAYDCFDEAVRRWCEATDALRTSFIIPLSAKTQSFAYPYIWHGMIIIKDIDTGKMLQIVNQVIQSVDSPSGLTPNEFDIGDSDEEAATNLANAININLTSVKNAVTAKADGTYIYLTARLANTEIHLKGDTHITVTETKQYPYRLTESLTWKHSNGTLFAFNTLGYEVRYASDRDLIPYAADWRSSPYTGTPSLWSHDGQQTVYLYPNPSSDGIVVMQGYCHDILWDDIASWDTIKMTLNDSHKIGLVYGTALVMLGIDAAQPVSADRSGAYQQLYGAAVQRAIKNNRPNRTITVGKRNKYYRRIPTEVPLL